MKNSNTLFLVVFFVLFFAFLSGCSEDDDSPANAVLVNGLQINISDALLICQGEYPGDEKEGYGCSLFFSQKE